MSKRVEHKKRCASVHLTEAQTRAEINAFLTKNSVKKLPEGEAMNASGESRGERVVKEFLARETPMLRTFEKRARFAQKAENLQRHIAEEIDKK